MLLFVVGVVAVVLLLLLLLLLSFLSRFGVCNAFVDVDALEILLWQAAQAVRISKRNLNYWQNHNVCCDKDSHQLPHNGSLESSGEEVESSSIRTGSGLLKDECRLQCFYRKGFTTIGDHFRQKNGFKINDVIFYFEGQIECAVAVIAFS